MRVLVCGDRNWSDKEFINNVLRETWYELDEHGIPLVIIHGCARGADSIAGKIGEQQSLEVIKFPADWERYGRSAGPIRNQQMLDEGKPDLVIAFNDAIDASKGTKDMVNRAKKSGIKTMVYHHGVVCTVYPNREYHEKENI